MKYKAPLPFIKARANATEVVMETLANDTIPWTAPGIVSPLNYLNEIQATLAQENLLTLKEAALAAAAGAWDAILDPWHKESVTALKLGRVVYAGTPKAPAWRPLKANGGGRQIITREGTEIESAWQTSNPAWVPKPGLTLASFQARRTTAETKARLYYTAEGEASNERGMLIDMANGIYETAVKWYELATATFPEDTVQGALIRTIPTNYNPNATPGQLHFSQHFAPAPNQVKLVWEAVRGEHYNVYAKAPNAPEFTKILDAVPFTQWMGEGLAAGMWAFKGEATNAGGVGESSAVIIVPINAALAA